jgi:HSP20 family protein
MENVMSKQELTPARAGGALAGRPHFFSPFQREMDRLFEDFGRGLERFNLAELNPRMDLAETEKDIELTVELPGMEPGDVDISVDDGVLTVSGQKRAETERKDKAWQLVERSYGAFSRSVRLPAGVETDKVSADMSKGVLKIVVPKPASAQSTHIAIKSAN